MPRSSGTYALPSGQPVVVGTTISDSVFNTLTTDIANELTNSIPRDGTAPPTANLPMGNFKITGLANGTLATDAVAFGQIVTTATGITNTPAGNIAATNVQTALNELDTEKADLTALAASTGSSLVGHTASGSGAVSTTVQSKLRESVSVKDFGAVGDGVTDDTTAITNAVAQATSLKVPLIYPKGSYLNSAVVYVVSSMARLVNRSYSGAVNTSDQASKSIISCIDGTPSTTPLNGADSRIPIAVTVQANGAQHASGIRTNLVNYSTDGNGCTGIYTSATGTTTSLWSAATHAETRHSAGTTIGLNSESASYDTVGEFYGLVLGNTTNSAGATHAITGQASVAHPSATAAYITGTNSADPKGGWVYGLRVSADSMRDAGVTLRIDATALVANHFLTAIGSASSSADISLQGSSSLGIALGGIYTNGAIRLKDDQTITYNSGATIISRHEIAQGTSRTTHRSGGTNVTGTAQAGTATTITLAAGASAITSDPTYVGATIRITSGTGLNQNRTITAYDGTTKIATVATWTTNPDSTSVYSIRVSTERVGFNLSATPSIWLNSTKVVGTQETGWTNAMTGTANKATAYATGTITLIQLAERVKALEDALRLHGLIAV